MSVMKAKQPTARRMLGNLRELGVQRLLVSCLTGPDRKAKGVQETLARDLEKIKRLDELLSRRPTDGNEFDF